jgi:maltodextrin utilization protein YvdJ
MKKSHARILMTLAIVIIAVVIVSAVFFSKRSGYDLPTFTAGMSKADADKLYESANKMIEDDLKVKTDLSTSDPAQARDASLAAQKAQNDLSLAYNTYISSIIKT